MVNEEISRLIERLKRSTKPDRALDRAIHAAIKPDDAGDAPEYTGSMVAALTLFESLTPRDICTAAMIEREQEGPPTALTGGQRC